MRVALAVEQKADHIAFGIGLVGPQFHYGKTAPLDRAARAQLLLGEAKVRHVSNEADSLAKRELLLSDSHQALRWGYLKRQLARQRKR